MASVSFNLLKFGLACQGKQRRTRAKNGTVFSRLRNKVEGYRHREIGLEHRPRWGLLGQTLQVLTIGLAPQPVKVGVKGIFLRNPDRHPVPQADSSPTLQVDAGLHFSHPLEMRERHLFGPVLAEMVQERFNLFSHLLRCYDRGGNRRHLTAIPFRQHPADAVW